MLERQTSRRKTRTTLQLALPAPCTIRSPETLGITTETDQLSGEFRKTRYPWLTNAPQPVLCRSHYATLTSFPSEETLKAYFMPSPISRQYDHLAGRSPTSHIITKSPHPSQEVTGVSTTHPITKAAGAVLFPNKEQ